jgi:hypothetical protein
MQSLSEIRNILREPLSNQINVIQCNQCGDCCGNCPTRVGNLCGSHPTLVGAEEAANSRGPFCGLQPAELMFYGSLPIACRLVVNYLRSEGYQITVEIDPSSQIPIITSVSR